MEFHAACARLGVRRALKPRRTPHKLQQAASMSSRLTVLAEGILQSWLVFCVVAYVGALTMGILDGPDELLRSDDPYIVGAVFGMVSGVGAGVFQLVRSLTDRPWVAHATCAVCLAIWCGLHVVVSMIPGEGREIAKFVAAGSAIAAIVGWPMFGRRFAWPVATVILMAGALFFAAWFVISSRR